jgi:hypothetical protein
MSGSTRALIHLRLKPKIPSDRHRRVPSSPPPTNLKTMDPVILPSTPLFSSYTFHSPISSWTKETYRLNDALADTQEGLPEGEGGEETDGRENKVDGSLDVKAKEKRERWVMGIDEAGRGPVLGELSLG